MSAREQTLVTILIGIIIGIAATLLCSEVTMGGWTFAVGTQAVTIAFTLVIAILALAAIRTQISLHEQTQRPTVQCDLVCVHEAAYLRLKNYGPVAACDVRILVEERPPSAAVDLSELPPMKYGIALLTPEAELLYFYVGPGEIPDELWHLKVTYSDPVRRSFAESVALSTGDLRRLDVGRHNNAPVVRRLETIAKALKGQV